MITANFTVEVDHGLIKISDNKVDFDTVGRPPEGVVGFDKEVLLKHVDLFLQIRQRYTEEVLDRELED